jgi:hypothetical protein
MASPTPVQSKETAEGVLRKLGAQAQTVISGLVQEYVKTHPQPKENIEEWFWDLARDLYPKAEGQLGDFKTSLETFQAQFHGDVFPFKTFEDFFVATVQNQVGFGSKSLPQKEPQEEPKSQDQSQKTNQSPSGSKGEKTTLSYTVEYLYGAYRDTYMELVSAAMFQILYAYQSKLQNKWIELFTNKPYSPGGETREERFGWPKEIPDFIALALGPLSVFRTRYKTLPEQARAAASLPKISDSVPFVQTYGPSALRTAITLTLKHLKGLTSEEMNSLIQNSLAVLAGRKISLTLPNFMDEAKKRVKNTQGGDVTDIEQVKEEARALRYEYERSIPYINIPPVTKTLFEVAYEQYGGSAQKTATQLGLWPTFLGIQLLGALGDPCGTKNHVHRYLPKVSSGHHSRSEGRGPQVKFGT